MNLPNGTLLQGGKYRIERVLGQGGFGITYLATHTALRTYVAVKEFFMREINSRDSDMRSVAVSISNNWSGFLSQRDKFKRESRRIYSLNCEHIVKVLDSFDENGTSYYVMEYLEGNSLDRILASTGGKMSEGKVRTILNQLLKALEYIHMRSIWHLDLKPANIVYCTNGVIKLIDFGASKMIDPNQTMATSTAVASTPGFAPMEQVSGEFASFGPWTDFYALGATLYVLLTGYRPPTTSQILNYGSNAFSFPESVTRRMRETVVWMMEPSYSQRPNSVAAIRQFLYKEPDEQTRVVHNVDTQETNVDINDILHSVFGSGYNFGGFQEQERKKVQKNTYNEIAIIIIIVSAIACAFGSYLWQYS